MSNYAQICVVPYLFMFFFFNRCTKKRELAAYICGSVYLNAFSCNSTVAFLKLTIQSRLRLRRELTNMLITSTLFCSQIFVVQWILECIAYHTFTGAEHSTLENGLSHYLVQIFFDSICIWLIATATSILIFDMPIHESYVFMEFPYY